MAFGYVPRADSVGGSLYAALHAVVGAPNLLRRLQWPVVRTLLQRAPGQVLVDVGCGDLQLSVELAKADAGSVIALDPAPRLARLGYVRERVYRLQLVRGDGERLPMANGSVDRILASSVLQMIPDPAALLSECRRVLRPGGRLVLTVPETYRYIPRLYGTESWLRRAVRALLGLPADYHAFLDRLNWWFGVRGKGYIAEPEVKRLLAAAELQPLDEHRAPGPFGTLVWEMCLLLLHRFGGARWPVLFAFLFYPFALVERTTGARNGGCELVIAAKRPDAHA